MYLNTFKHSSQQICMSDSQEVRSVKDSGSTQHHNTEEGYCSLLTGPVDVMALSSLGQMTCDMRLNRISEKSDCYLKAAAPNQEFQLTEVLEQSGKTTPDHTSFFTDFEKNELSSNPSRKEFPNTSHHNSDTGGRGLDSKCSSYFTSLDSTIGDLEQRTQQLIDKINENRKQDHLFMNNCRESLLMKVSSLAEKLEERVFHVYDHNSKIIQEKLQELSDTMERIRQIETELKQVCLTVEMLYKDLCGQSEL